MASFKEMAEDRKRDLFSRRFVAYIPTDSFVKGRGHRVSFVFENESGHFPNGDTPEGGKTEPWYWGYPDDEAKSFELAKKTARSYNERRGISEREELDVLSSSLRLSLRSGYRQEE